MKKSNFAILLFFGMLICTANVISDGVDPDFSSNDGVDPDFSLYRKGIDPDLPSIGGLDPDYSFIIGVRDRFSDKRGIEIELPNNKGVNLSFS
ncbi:MAG: hypothetical protein R2795_24495 [Saprospiraceae bacterium]